MKKLLIPLTLVTLLASCGNVKDTAPTSQDVFIPKAEAPRGTSNGTTKGTVYISPSKEEIQIIKYINEIRTKGTLGGENLIGKNNCLTTSNFKPNKKYALSYNGIVAYSAKKHTEYMTKTPDGYSHIETKTNSPYFYGKELSNRINKARKDLDLAAHPYYKIAENIHRSSHSNLLKNMHAQIDSTKHCENIIDTAFKGIGVGYGKSKLNPQYRYFTIDFIN